MILGHVPARFSAYVWRASSSVAGRRSTRDYGSASGRLGFRRLAGSKAGCENFPLISQFDQTLHRREENRLSGLGFLRVRIMAGEQLVVAVAPDGSDPVHRQDLRRSRKMIGGQPSNLPQVMPAASSQLVSVRYRWRARRPEGASAHADEFDRPSAAAPASALGKGHRRPA
jgi:hypothetical protein